VRQFEIVGLVETWVEEQSWEKKEKRKNCRGNNNRGLKRQENGEKKGCMERNVHVGNKLVENNDNIQQRDEANNKMCRRYNKGKQRRLCALGRGLQQRNRGARNWEEKSGDGKRNSKTRWKMERGTD
jgi:hypothetical protein